MGVLFDMYCKVCKVWDAVRKEVWYDQVIYLTCLEIIIYHSNSPAPKTDSDIINIIQADHFSHPVINGRLFIENVFTIYSTVLSCLGQLLVNKVI